MDTLIFAAIFLVIGCCVGFGLCLLFLFSSNRDVYPQNKGKQNPKVQKKEDEKAILEATRIIKEAAGVMATVEPVPSVPDLALLNATEEKERSFLRVHLSESASEDNIDDIMGYLKRNKLAIR